MTTPQFVELAQKCNNIEEDTAKAAQGSIAAYAEYNKAMNEYQKQVHPQFEGMAELCKDLYEQVEEQMEKRTKESMSKILHDKKEKCYMNSEAMRKDMKKGKIDVKQFLDKFITERRQYHSLNMKEEILNSAQ